MAYTEQKFTICYKNYDIEQEYCILSCITNYHVCKWMTDANSDILREHLATFDNLEDAMKFVLVHESVGA